MLMPGKEIELCKKMQENSTYECLNNALVSEKFLQVVMDARSNMGIDCMFHQEAEPNITNNKFHF